MEFKIAGSRGEMTKRFYRQVHGTSVYLNQEEGRNAKYNSLLLPTPDSHIEDWMIMRNAWVDQQRIKAYKAHRDRVIEDP